MGGKAKILDFYPCLFDKKSVTAIDTHYFYQAIWAFKDIVSCRVRKHVDIGSDVRFVGMLTPLVHVTFIDIRPMNISLENFSCERGSILSIPFKNHSVLSLSSLHVIEHIGLGRYGDPLDPKGPEKACQELQRVLAPGGRLYVSVPIGRSRVQFNGQRVFEISEILSFFSQLKLIDFSGIDSYGNFRKSVNPVQFNIGDKGGLDFGLGMFCFKRKEIKKKGISR